MAQPHAPQSADSGHEARDGLSVAADYSLAASVGVTARRTGCCLRVAGMSSADPRHEPVMLAEIVELLAPALVEPLTRHDAEPVLVDCTLGLGGHAEALLAACPARPPDRTRPRPAGAGPGRRAAGPASPTGPPWSRRSTTSCPRCWTGWAARASRASCSISGCPRCRSTTRSRGFAYAVRRPAGHADGPPGADRGRGAQHLLAGRADPDPADATARSGSPIGSPGGSSPSGQREPFTTSARLVRLLDDAIPAAARNVRAATRPSGPSRRCGSRSTPSWPPWRRCCPARRRARRRRPDRGAGLPLAGGPAGQADAGRRRPRPRPAGPARGAGRAGPQLRLLTRGAQRPTAAEVAANPRAASARLRAAERIMQRTAA